MTTDIPEISIELGIRQLVAVLNMKGLVTTMSCEGHPGEARRGDAWIELDPSQFKAYMRKSSARMKQFLLAGEDLWELSIDYFGQSKFRGLGRPRPRLAKMKRIVSIEMRVRVCLHDAARSSGRKTAIMRAAEQAAARYL